MRTVYPLFRCGKRLTQLPDVVAEDRCRRPVSIQAVDLDLGAADHEVGVDPGDVDPAGEQHVRLEVSDVAEHVREAGAERDVACLVLVEERVVEDEPRLLDGGGAVDECDLPQRGRLLVSRELSADDVGA